MSTTADRPTSTTPRRPALDRDTAMALAATEYDRVLTLLAGLTDDEWTRPTDCAGWDVRAMAGHMLGMMQMVASVPEFVRQQIATAKRQKNDGGPSIDAMTAYQVDKNAHLSPAGLVEQVRRTGPAAARGRRRTPAAVRNRKLPEPQTVGGTVEWWTFGYLFDVILTRDPFMHRIDITRATGRPMQVTADHEGVIVADVVREWADRHGQPFRLDLAGPAGGSWGVGGGGEHIAMDALEFVRVLSGRGTARGLLAQQVPF